MQLDVALNLSLSGALEDAAYYDLLIFQICQRLEGR